jgi:TusA-related sulfurtransferase
MDTGLEHRGDYLIDFRRTASFIGLLELSRRFDEIREGNNLEILVRDQDTITDICKLLARSAYEMDISEDLDSLYRISIRKNTINQRAS